MNRVRAIYDRWPEFRERLPEVWTALRDSSVPTWSRLNRVWWNVNRHLLDGPEWLSSRTDSLRDIRFRRKRRERSGVGERFHRLLHSMHTIQASAALWAVTSMLLTAVSVVVGLEIERQGFPEPGPQLAGTLVTLTEVVGGAAGILFAVIVFGIQFHGERLGQASYLARYFGRREGLVPIAAFSLAVVTANACVALLSSHGLPHSALPMACLDYLFVPFVLFLLLFLLHRMVVSVSADIFDRSLVPGLCWEYERAIDEEIYHAGLIKEYEKALADVGLRYSCGAGMLDLDPVTPVKFTLPGKWQVTDVKLTGLRDLAAYIHARCPDYEGVVAVGPEDVLDNTVVFVLSARRDDHGRQQRDTQTVPGEYRHEIGRMLRRIFRMGRVRKRDVVGVLADFEKTIVSQARHDRADQLERSLGVLEQLIELRLEREDSWERHQSFRRQRLADNLEGHEYYEMVSNAVESGDREKVSALLVFACPMMRLAVRRINPSLYHRAGEMIVAVYYRAIEGTELADYVGDYLDNVVLTSLSSQFEYAHSAWRLDPPKIAAQTPVLMVDLAWRLKLMRAALEAGRANDATNFQDRLFRWDEHSGKRFADPHEESNIPPELREASDLLSYATIITAAWCLHLIERNYEHADTAKAVFQRCASDLGSREHLLRLWEAVRSKSFTGRPLDDPFGVMRWTAPPVERTGVSSAYNVSDGWIDRGFMALMLARPSSREYEVPDAMRACPPFRPNCPEEAKKLAESIIANDVVRKELLHIEDDKRDEAVGAVVSIFAERLRLFKLDRLDAVVTAKLGDEHRDRLHTEVAKELEDDYGLRSILAKLSGLQADARASFLPRIRYPVLLPKGSFARCREHSVDFAPLIASGIQVDENTLVTHAAKRIAAPTTEVRRLAELAGAVRDAVLRLRETTTNQILVFVPDNRRIIEAILGQHGWNLPNRRVLGDNHIGDWEGCHLLRIPHFDATSVVIVDTHAFFGRIKQSAEARLDLEIVNPNKEEHDDAMRQARVESDPSKIPETSAIKVLADFRYSASLGLQDPNAALRVDLDLTRIGNALVESEGVYHRPDCDLLSAAEGEIIYTLARRLRSDEWRRMPCEHCRPNEWEEQAESAVHNATIADC